MNCGTAKYFFLSLVLVVSGVIFPGYTAAQFMNTEIPCAKTIPIHLGAESLLSGRNTLSTMVKNTVETDSP